MDHPEPVKSASQDPSALSKNIPTPADFVIVCGSGAEIKCEKDYLCERSSVLRAVIERAGSEGVTNRVEMTDMMEESVKAFREFLYYRDRTEALKNSGIAFELLRAAHKYEIKSLQTAMERVILTKETSWFGVDNAVRLFAFANHLESGEKLRTKALGVVKENLSTLKESACYKELCRNDPVSAMDLSVYKSMCECYFSK